MRQRRVAAFGIEHLQQQLAYLGPPLRRRGRLEEGASTGRGKEASKRNGPSKGLNTGGRGGEATGEGERRGGALQFASAQRGRGVSKRSMDGSLGRPGRRCRKSGDYLYERAFLIFSGAAGRPMRIYFCNAEGSYKISGC